MMVQNFQVLRTNDDGTYTIMEDIHSTIPMEIQIMINLSDYIVIDETVYYILNVDMLSEAYGEARIRYELDEADYVVSPTTSDEEWMDFLENAMDWLEDREHYILTYIIHQL